MNGETSASQAGPSGLGRLYPAVPTPLRSDYSIDTELLGDLTDRLLNSGASGVVLFGTTGEGTYFSTAQKIKALETLLANGCPASRLILATGCCAYADALAITRTSVDLNCAATLVLPPFFYRQASDDGLFDWYAALIGAAPSARVLLYHIPALAGVGFTPELVERLKREFSDAVLGVKDSTPNSTLASALLAQKDDGVYVSTEANLAQHLAGGGAGVISASLTLTLPLARSVLTDNSRLVATRLAEMRQLFMSFPLIWAVKTVLARQTGIAAWRVLTPPYRPPAEDLEQKLWHAYDALAGIGSNGHCPSASNVRLHAESN